MIETYKNDKYRWTDSHLAEATIVILTKYAQLNITLGNDNFTAFKHFWAEASKTSTPNCWSAK